MNFSTRLSTRLSEMPRSLRSSIAWGYCLLLIYLLIMPSPLAPFGTWGLDTEHMFDRTLSSYLQHVIAYVGFVCVFWWCYRPLTTQSIALLLAGSCLHGAVFEGLQYFVPTRFCDWPDLFCNLTGVILGAGLVRILLIGEISFSNSPSEAPNKNPSLPNAIRIESGE